MSSKQQLAAMLVFLIYIWTYRIVCLRIHIIGFSYCLLMLINISGIQSSHSTVCSHLKATSQMAPLAQCNGPFHLEMSPGYNYVETEASAMVACVQQCITDPCCRAGGLKAGQCVTSVIKTYTMDFTKQVSKINICK